MPDQTAIPPILAFPRTPPSVAVRGPVDLVAAKVRVGGSALTDRIELSAAASRAGGTLTPYRSPADRMEAATGVARARLVDRLA